MTTGYLRSSVFVEGKGNYDRLVSFMGALFICKTYQQNRFVKEEMRLRNQKRNKDSKETCY